MWLGRWLDVSIIASLISGAVRGGTVIGKAAKASGVSPKMLSYYEAIGLLPTAARTQGGDRPYGAREVQAMAEAS
jgi:hypothetical protein